MIMVKIMMDMVMVMVIVVMVMVENLACRFHNSRKMVTLMLMKVANRSDGVSVAVPSDKR